MWGIDGVGACNACFPLFVENNPSGGSPYAGEHAAFFGTQSTGTPSGANTPNATFLHVNNTTAGSGNNGWALYGLGVVAPGAVQQSLGHETGYELDIENLGWAPVFQDPFSAPATGRTEGGGFGCGAGVVGTLNCTTAIYVFTNRASWEQGILFGNNALDTTSGNSDVPGNGADPCALCLPGPASGNGYSVAWYSASGNVGAFMFSKATDGDDLVLTNNGPAWGSLGSEVLLASTANPTFTGVVTVPNGNASAPSIVGGTSTTGLYFGSASLFFSSSGTEAATINASADTQFSSGSPANFISERTDGCSGSQDTGQIEFEGQNSSMANATCSKILGTDQNCQSTGSELGALSIYAAGGIGTAGTVSPMLTFTGESSPPGLITVAKNAALVLSGSTSGTIELVTAAAAGSNTATFPANTGTLAELNLAQTFSAGQTFSSSVTMSNLGNATGTGYVCIVTSSGGLRYDASACNPSLEWMKTIRGIIDPPTALAEGLKLKPFWYTWNQKVHPTYDTREQPGFGAIATEKVDARLVSYDKKGQLEGVRYDHLTALEQAEIDELQSEIATLKAQSKKQDAEIYHLVRTVANDNREVAMLRGSGGRSDCSGRDCRIALKSK